MISPTAALVNYTFIKWQHFHGCASFASLDHLVLILTNFWQTLLTAWPFMFAYADIKVFFVAVRKVGLIFVPLVARCSTGKPLCFVVWDWVILVGWIVIIVVKRVEIIDVVSIVLDHVFVVIGKSKNWRISALFEYALAWFPSRDGLSLRKHYQF